MPPRPVVLAQDVWMFAPGTLGEVASRQGSCLGWGVAWRGLHWHGRSKWGPLLPSWESRGHL